GAGQVFAQWLAQVIRIPAGRETSFGVEAEALQEFGEALGMWRAVVIAQARSLQAEVDEGLYGITAGPIGACAFDCALYALVLRLSTIQRMGQFVFLILRQLSFENELRARVLFDLQLLPDFFDLVGAVGFAGLDTKLMHRPGADAFRVKAHQLAGDVTES